MDDQEKKYKQADLFIESVRIGMSRARWSYSVVIIICITIFTCSWNVYFSWIKTVFIPDKVVNVADSNSCSFAKNQEIVKYAQQNLLINWTQSNYIEIPLIGSKIHITDASIILSCLVTLVLIWLFFATRRENHIIGRTLQYYKDVSDDLKIYVYYGISLSNLFSTYSKNDEPIYSIEVKDNPKQVPGIRFLLLLIFYVPGILLLSLIILDLCSFNIPSMYRPFFLPPSPLQYTIKIIFMELFCLICAFSCIFLGYMCHRYERANSKILNEFAGIINWPRKE